MTRPSQPPASECTCNPAERTGGDHDPSCPEWQPECTCYESHGGHMPGCPMRGFAPYTARKLP